MRYNVAKFAPLSSDECAQWPADISDLPHYNPAMATDTFASWTLKALKYSGISQAEAARRLAAEHGISIDRSAINKVIKGRRALSATELVALAAVTGFPAPVTESLTVSAPTPDPPKLADLLIPAMEGAFLAFSEIQSDPDHQLAQELATIVVDAARHPISRLEPGMTLEAAMRSAVLHQVSAELRRRRLKADEEHRRQIQTQPELHGR